MGTRISNKKYMKLPEYIGAFKNEWYNKKERAGSELSKIKNVKDRIKHMDWKDSLTSKYILTNWQNTNK